MFIRLSRSRHRRRLFRSRQAPAPAANLSYSRAEAARIAMRSASRRDSSDLAEDRAHLLRIVSAWTGLSGANAEAREGDGRQPSQGDAFVRQLAAHPLAAIVGSEPLRDTGGHHRLSCRTGAATGICGTDETCLPRRRCWIESPR